MFERLAQIDRHFIKSKVETGHYTSEIEVIRDAIRKMREHQEKNDRFKLAVLRGVADINAGKKLLLPKNY